MDFMEAPPRYQALVINAVESELAEEFDWDNPDHMDLAQLKMADCLLGDF